MTVKIPALFLLLSGCSAFSQTTPGNAAAENMKKRLQSLRSPIVPRPLAPSVILFGKPTHTVCSIPLINVLPAANSKMPVVKPPSRGNLPGDIIDVPAPACEANLFLNK